MIKIRPKATIVAVALFAGCAFAASSGPAGVIKARKANYKEIGGAFKTINDEIKSGTPDMNTVRPLAKDLAARASYALKFFPRGSGPESRLPTRAKAAIWTEQANFNRLQQQMITAANSLNAAAAAGNTARLTSARDALGSTCKSCHDRYREPE